RCGTTTETSGIACSAVHCATARSLIARSAMPIAAISSASAPAASPIRRSFAIGIAARGGALLADGTGSRGSSVSINAALLGSAMPAMQDTEDGRNEEKSRDRGDREPPDHRATERGVLLAAFTER